MSMTWEERQLHDAHLRYQRQALAPDKAKAYVAALPCSEVRGLTRLASKRKLSQQFDVSWFTGLRSNFWKAYFDTLMFMGK